MLWLVNSSFGMFSVLLWLMKLSVVVVVGLVLSWCSVFRKGLGCVCVMNMCGCFVGNSVWILLLECMYCVLFGLCGVWNWLGLLR